MRRVGRPLTLEEVRVKYNISKSLANRILRQLSPNPYRYSRFKGGPVSPRRRSLRAEIYHVLQQSRVAQPNGSLTAWQIAKHIDALGSSVSSMMFKMAKAGQINRTASRTAHGGWRYQLQS